MQLLPSHCSIPVRIPFLVRTSFVHIPFERIFSSRIRFVLVLVAAFPAFLLLPDAFLSHAFAAPHPYPAAARTAGQTVAQSAAQAAPTVITDTFDTDARLQQVAAVHAEGVPLGELLTLLSEKTGVSLKADLYVADDKIIAFSPARPLRDTLRDIAALYNDVWQTTPREDEKLLANLTKKPARTDEKSEQKPRYILTRRLSARHYEDGLEQAVAARMLAQLEAQVNALKETSEDLAKRPADDLIRQNLESPSTHGRQATRLYAQLSPEQRTTLFTNGSLSLSFAAATPAQQQMLRDAFTEVVTTLKVLDEKQRAEFPNVHILIDTPDKMERYGLRFRLTRTNNAGLSALVVQVILGENTYMTMGNFESDSQWLLPPHGDPYTRKSLARAAKLPAPEAVRELEQTESHAWVDRLSALAAAARCPIFADYYRSPALVHDLKPAPPAPPDALIPGLDAFCKPSGYLWWMQKQTLLLRKRDWYTQRRYEVADRWMRDMQRRLRRQQEVPTYADLGRVSDLTLLQIAGMNGALAPGNGGAENRSNAPRLVNLEAQEGLHELLAVLQASFEPSALLPQSEVQENAEQAGNPPARPTQALNATQAALIGTFLQTMRQANTPGALNSFAVQAFCATPATLQAGSLPVWQNVQVTLLWKVRKGKSRVSNSTETEVGSSAAVREQRWWLWLPLQIPDDRSEKTKIETTQITP